MKVQGQTAVVTGGGSGLGLAAVVALRKQGARVMVWDRVDVNEPNRLFCDVQSDESVTNALATTIEQLGVPRILIHCAGIAPAAKLVGKNGPMPLEAFREVIDINLIGTFNVMRVVAHAMIQDSSLQDLDERGVIINTASIAAYEGQIGQAAYSASKGGVIAMTLPVARELAEHKIRVNTIAPGLMATPLLLNMPEAVQQSLVTSIPFPKRFGAPEEFAALALHICENSMINGETIRLDGALRMASR